MTNRKEMYARIFKWCADVGHCPLESDMNELIGFFENEKSGSSPFCQRETDISEFGGKARQVAAGQVGGDARNLTPEEQLAFRKSLRNSVSLIHKAEPTAVDMDALQSCTFDSLSVSGFGQEPNKWDTAQIYEGATRMFKYLASTSRLSGVTKPTTTKEEQEND